MASADVLSQSEIDELLAALSTGTVSAEEIAIEESKKKIKTYKKLSAEALQELLRIRRKGYISKNKIAYTRKEKHKIVQYD